MAIDTDPLPDSTTFSALRGHAGLLLGTVVGVFSAAFGTLARGIMRAPRGYETNDGFFVGDIPPPARPARAMNAKDYDVLAAGLDRLLEILREPGTELSDEDKLLGFQLAAARAQSLRVRSGLPVGALLGA